MILDGAEDDKKMPLLDHLVELRRRLLYSIVGLVVAFVVGAQRRRKSRKLAKS